MRQLLILIAIISLSSDAIGQGLPRGLTSEEKALVESGGYNFGPVDPTVLRMSVGEVRSIAEWEELQAIAITWTQFRDILADIVRSAVKEVNVIIVTRDSVDTRDQIAGYGIDPDHNIIYVESDYNSIWMRDYGPNPAYVEEVDSLVLVDWIYNRPRPKDDAVPGVIAEYLGVPMISTTAPPYDLVNTGGNYMTDGLGRAFSSNLVLDENGPNNIWGVSNHDEADVDAIMRDYMGIQEYVKMAVLPYDGIHHIDMHMKMLDESRIMVGQYPEGIADGPQIEANIQYVLENFKVATGRDYEIIRIPMPPDNTGRYPHQGGDYRTYLNSLFVNKTILVPTYEERYDTTALRIWDEAMPGYEIVGIDCNQIIPLGGAIHCITKEIGVADPLWVSHEAPGAVEFTPSITLDAGARHRSGVEAVQLFYSRDGGETFDSLQMASSGEQWSVDVADVIPNDTIAYFFKAVSVSGKVVTRPLTAPEGTFRVTVGEGTSPIYSLRAEQVDMRLYPNPASALTCIELTIPSTREGRLMILDAHGRIVQVLPYSMFLKGENKAFFDAGQMAPGVYIARYESGGMTKNIRFVVY